MVAFLTFDNNNRLEEYFKMPDSSFDKKTVVTYKRLSKGKSTCNRDLTSIWSISNSAVICHREGGKNTKSTKPTKFDFLELNHQVHSEANNAFVLDDGTLITYWENHEGIIKIIAFESNEDGAIQIRSENSFDDTEIPSFCLGCKKEVPDFVVDSVDIRYKRRGIVMVSTEYFHDDCMDENKSPGSYFEIQTDTSPPIQKYLSWPGQAEWNGYTTDKASFDLGDRGTLECTRKWERGNQSQWKFEKPQAELVGLSSPSILGIIEIFNTNSHVTVSNPSLEDRVGFLETVISDLQGTLQNLMGRLP